MRESLFEKNAQRTTQFPLQGRVMMPIFCCLPPTFPTNTAHQARGQVLPQLRDDVCHVPVGHFQLLTLDQSSFDDLVVEESG